MDKELLKHPVRTACLGSDRFLNRYWWFPGEQVGHILPAPGLRSPLPALGLPPPTSALGLRSPCHICTGLGLPTLWQVSQPASLNPKSPRIQTTKSRSLDTKSLIDSALLPMAAVPTD